MTKQDKMAKNRSRDAAYGRFARKMRRFPPKFMDTASSTRASLAAGMNPNAQVFVPDASMQDANESQQQEVFAALLPTLDGSETAGFNMPPADLEQIETLRKSQCGQRIKYSVKDLLSLKPLNPNAPEFTPFWLQGIHTERDFALFQAQGMLPQFGCGNVVQEKTFFHAQKAS
jgi:hypothetical protein